MVMTAFIAAILGILSGLGIGGGSLLMLWLTLVQNTEYIQAKRINLAFYIASVSAVVLIRAVKNPVLFLRIIPAALSGCIAVICLSKISASWDVFWIRKAFGCLLVISAIREFTAKSAKKNQAD